MIHEVYYHDDDSIMGYTDRESEPWAEELDGLKQTLERMRAGCDKPVLDIKELDAYFEWCRENPEYGPEEPVYSFSSIEELLEDLDGE